MGITKEQIEISAKDRTKGALQQAEKGFLSLDKGIATALKGAAAFAGVVGLGAVIKNSLDTADAIAKTAKAAGVGTTFLQEMRFAAEQSGVATNMLDDGMRRLTRRIGLAADGGGPAIKAFEKMNIAVHDVNGNVRNTENIFQDLTSGLGNVKSAAEQAALASAFFGDDAGPKLALLLQEGSTGIETLRDKAQELGLVLSEEMVAGAEEAGDKISQLEQILSIKTIKAVADNAEVIGELAESLIDLVSAAAKAAKVLTDFGEAVGKNVALFFSDSDLAKVRKLEIAYEKINNQIKSVDANGSGASFLPLWQQQSDAIKKDLDEIKSKYQSIYGSEPDTAAFSGTPSSVVPAEIKTPAKAANSDNFFAQPTNRDVIDSDAANQKETARVEASLQAIELQMATEEERLSASYINREMIVENAFNTGIIEKERRDAIIQDLEKKHNEEVTRIQEESLSAQELMWKTSFDGKLQVMQGVLGQVSNLMQSENKKQFEIGKKAAIAQAVISTYQSAVSSYNALAGIPIVGPVLGGIAAAAAIIYGKNQVSRIKSQQFGGGSVGGGSAPTGTYSANPNTGAPTGSPAGGVTSVQSISGTNNQTTPTRIVNLTYVAKNQSDRESGRELVEQLNKAVGDGVEINARFE